MPDLNKYDIVYNETSRSFEVLKFQSGNEGEAGFAIAKASKQLLIQFILDAGKFYGLIEGE